jgi:sulfite reductase (NADPH) flavoprotein alpha-component
MPIKLPEIPDDAPFHAEQREWLKKYLAEFAKAVSASTPSSEASVATAAATRGRLLIMYGSQSGNAESLAEGFAERLRSDEYAVEVLDMEAYEKVDLRREAMVLIITSTWGEGDPPDNAEAFWNHFSSDAQMPLKKTRFSVLALGDTSYADFCEMGIRFDARFEELGAERIASRIDCDVDYEDMAEEWFRVVCAALDDIQLAPVSAEAAALAAGGGETAAAVKVESVYSKKNPFPAPLLRGLSLNKEGSFKDTRHFEFSLDGSGFEYEVGDVLGVVPRNSPGLVDELLVLLPFNTTVKVDVPDGRKLPLREALIDCYDLRTINKRMLKNWRDKAGSPYLRSVIDADSEEHIAEMIDGREIIDLVLEFPADFKSAQEFVDGLRKLNPRLYSIASSPKAHPGEVHLTVAKVEYHTHGRKRQGVCSCYLADRVAEGETVGVFVQGAKHFKLPAKGEVPVIMVGPGTGVAPFRAFLEERQAVGAEGRNWLFFGNPHEATDFFYQEEFTAMQEAGFLTRLDVAWSRDQDHKIYVQDKIRENSEEIWQWIKEGAHFYVCGDAIYMAGDVDKALHDLIEQHGGLSETEAAEYVARMKRSKRYQRDVY